MSCDEFKTSIRAELKQLQGKSKTQVYEYFKNLIGEAEEVDVYDDGTVEWFHYEDKAGEFCPVYSYKTGQWGVDYIHFLIQMTTPIPDPMLISQLTKLKCNVGYSKTNLEYPKKIVNW
ncbi:hypothetical protein [Paenibacillus oleatilyticus]|uniref:hypothetical protein n=1 Tax=Paenibacillus oleatilyticus TaxID=2594886 RepID=UPI001C1FE145|nr:hypothetical protein [Paenibacillus oleatilyticus]MBU7316021.1 hypothetical protein [Paenibacillus oleatilyticus]